MGWSGQPVIVEELLFKPKHGLVDQSLHSRMGVETTNGDGFGVGWYGTGDTPGVFRSTEPAWNDRNLRELAGQIVSPRVLAHIRASTGSPVQQTNCHPFRHHNWLWMHNGAIREFHNTKRDLMMAVDPSLFLDIEGSTDSETLFFLALTFGLAEDPFGAVARAIGFVEVGQQVRLLYDAFPYQHYGTYRGRIVQVSQTILAGTDISVPLTLEGPAYRAIVELEQPDVDVNGKRVPLQPDMLLKADIILERRTLIDWMLNPVTSARVQG